MPRRARPADANAGKLRIGDDWNAIRIIALSQSNPLKAVAEFVENSIDAHAKTITITRGREHGAHYLSIRDDGEGVPRDADGAPDFKYVATHICDSIKRRLKLEGGGTGLQGEFGIGLLSFWTVGDTLTMTSTGADQRAWQMTMSKGDSRYRVHPKRVLFAERGTELRIAPLLEGTRSLLHGEKIQWYLASELRDRIRDTQVRITVIDRLARKQYAVEPRRFEGRLLHDLPPVRTLFGDAYAEIYLDEPGEAPRIALTRSGTRVVEELASLPGLDRAPWTSRHLQGLIDAPFLNLTPGTRSGIVHDERFAALLDGLESLAAHLNGLIEAQHRAEQEQATRQSMKAIQRAFHEAMLALPPEEYDWFDVQGRARRGESTPAAASIGYSPGEHDELSDSERERAPAADEPSELHAASVALPQDALGAWWGAPPTAPAPTQRQFFEVAGPLFAALITPAAASVRIGERRAFRALPRDRSRRRVTDALSFAWRVTEGEGFIESASDQEATFVAGAQPGLTRLQVSVTQRETSVHAEALVTVTDRANDSTAALVHVRGLPGYHFERAAGDSWRSRFDLERNLIVVNSGHRDFVFATRHRALQLRYIVRLYVKELVLRNFTGAPPEQLLERMVELSLYAEEKLKPG